MICQPVVQSDNFLEFTTTISRMAGRNGMLASSSQETLPVATGVKKRGWLSQLRDDVSLSHTDIPVLACCTVSGLCDSVAFNATGTFASMQTVRDMRFPFTLFLHLNLTIVGQHHLPRPRRRTATSKPAQPMASRTRVHCFLLGWMFPLFQEPSPPSTAKGHSRPVLLGPSMLHLHRRRLGANTRCPVLWHKLPPYHAVGRRGRCP